MLVVKSWMTRHRGDLFFSWSVTKRHAERRLAKAMMGLVPRSPLWECRYRYRRNGRAHWPIIVLHFDFKDVQAPLLHAVWRLLE
jgi:hypothetical protein